MRRGHKTCSSFHPPPCRLGKSVNLTHLDHVAPAGRIPYIIKCDVQNFAAVVGQIIARDNTVRSLG